MEITKSMLPALSFGDVYVSSLQYISPLPFLFFLLSLIVYGFWLRDLFRPVAQWNPARMARRGFYFCLLNLGLIGLQLHEFTLWMQNPFPCAGIHPAEYTGATLTHTVIFATQLVLYAALLWWHGHSKKFNEI